MASRQKHVLTLLLILVPIIGFAHDVTSADQELLRNGGLWAYIRVGATHMLTGYDHLLFLAGVIFYLKGFKDILKFITVFTPRSLYYPYWCHLCRNNCQ